MTDHANQAPSQPDGTPVLTGEGHPATVDTAGPPDITPAAASRARWAVTGVFFVNGLLLASYIVRIPTLKADHHYGEAEFGVILTLLGVSALLTMQFVGRLVARFGTALIVRTMLLVMPLVLLGVGLARDTAELAIGVVLLGAVHGTVDVAMNAHAVLVERVARRPIMNGCHAAWSISAVLASLIGAAVIRAGVSPRWHFLLVGVVMLVVSVPLLRFLLPAAADRTTERAEGAKARRSGWRDSLGRVLMYGAMGATLMICEAAVTSWSGIFLHEARGATLAAASFAYLAYTGMQTVVRLFGDRLNSRFGPAVIFQVSAVIAVLGLVVVVAVPSAPAAIAGFAITGTGMAVLLPLIFSAVGHAGGDGPGAATFVSRVTTFTYGGILLGPALVGWFAAASSLTWTFAGLIPIMVAVALNGRVMRVPSPAAPAQRTA